MSLTREQWLEAGWAFAQCIESRRSFWAYDANGESLNGRAVELIHFEAERLAAGGEPVECPPRPVPATERTGQDGVSG